MKNVADLVHARTRRALQRTQRQVRQLYRNVLGAALFASITDGERRCGYCGAILLLVFPLDVARVSWACPECFKLVHQHVQRVC